MCDLGNCALDKNLALDKNDALAKTCDKHSGILCQYCPTLYCRPCFIKCVTESYPYTCKTCKSVWNSRWVETQVPNIRSDLLTSKANYLFKIEKGIMPYTQRYAIYTKNANKIKEDIIHVSQMIKDLQANLRVLKQSKFDLDQDLTQPEKHIYIQKCKNIECRGYLDEQKQCGLCFNTYFNAESISIFPMNTNIMHTNWEWRGEPLPELTEIIQRINHLAYTLYPTIRMDETMTNQDLRIRYLLNELSEEEFRTNLLRRHHRLECLYEYHILIFKYLESVSAMTHDKTFLDKEKEAREHSNESISDLNHLYHSTCALI
jgi:hypothetical protein